MIKINLLPVRAHKKKETAKQQITIFFLAVIGAFLVSGALYAQIRTKIAGAKDEIARSEKELQDLKKRIGEIDKIKSLEAEVKRKLDILDQLRKGKTGPVQRLATLSDSTPDKLWLTKYSESGEKVSIGGIALMEEGIAELMNNLRNSEHYSDVELIVTEQTVVGGIKAKKFDLTCKIKKTTKEEKLPVKK